MRGCISALKLVVMTIYTRKGAFLLQFSLKRTTSSGTNIYSVLNQLALFGLVLLETAFASGLGLIGPPIPLGLGSSSLPVP